ncbi:hypothetical protein BDW59DRAFT_162090 [Aspergillus cavernicola]|uniref:Uncharacterized protein n=1 Tax=Aspergillus cavernicola TaxID=176166 RepID=A0ABR4IB78_9EURO
MACFRGFVSWAIGLAGPPNLIVITFGDFSHDGHFGWSQLLLCRERTPSTQQLFRIRGHQGHEYALDQIENARQMLSACPTQSTVFFFGDDDWEQEAGEDTDFSAQDEDDGGDPSDDNSDDDN